MPVNLAQGQNPPANLENWIGEPDNVIMIKDW
jgi:hypothetical protein